MWTTIFATLVAADEVIIVSPDSPLPAIQFGSTKTEENAAIDLCAYLSRVVGREIRPENNPETASPVVFHVGSDAFVQQHAPEAAGLFADGFIIKGVQVDGQFHLILAGRVEDASQWAIEQFLKDYCGVRWLFPDPKYGEIVPSRPTIKIDRAVSRTVEPHYAARSSAAMYHYNPARTHLRGGGGNLGEYGDHAIQFIFNNGSHSGEIFEKHPEWFAFFNGKRNWWEYGNGWQICTTNPGTVEHTVQYVLDFFAKNPKAMVVSVGNNDGWGECECPDCTAFLNSANPPYNVGERWFTWVNEVARRVGKQHPDKTIVSLAYSQASTPTRFKLEPNVAITKTIVLDNELQLAEQWSRVCKSVNLYSYMYGNSFLGFRHYPHAARDFLKWGHDKLGAKAHVTEAGGDWTFDGPKNDYLQALQWNVDVDIDAVMDDYCRHSYGKAAVPMRAFWDRLEEIYERRRPVPHGEKNRRMLFYQWTGWVVSSYVQPNDEFQEYSAEDVEFLDSQMTLAIQDAASDDETVRFRVDRMRDAWRYYRTALVSFTRFYPMESVKTKSKLDVETQVALASEIAEIRLERDAMLGAMRSYPHINPRTAGPNYWSWNEALTIFNHELTLMHEACDSITAYLTKADGPRAARAFWEAIGPADPLFNAASIQIDGLDQASRVDILLNGGFESGDFTHWETSGNVTVVSTKDRGRGFVAHSEGGQKAELSQRAKVSPGETYRLSALVRYPTAPPRTAVPLESIVEFYSGPDRIWHSEPTRTVIRSKSPHDGWIPLRSVVEVPPGATEAIIRLRRTFEGATADWDQVQFERIGTGIDASKGQRDTSINPAGDSPATQPVSNPQSEDDRSRRLIMPGVTD